MMVGRQNRLRGKGTPNQMLQQTAAAVPVFDSSISLGAATLLSFAFGGEFANGSECPANKRVDAPLKEANTRAPGPMNPSFAPKENQNKHLRRGFF
jgi:hypothetical protein